MENVKDDLASDVAAAHHLSDPPITTLTEHGDSLPGRKSPDNSTNAPGLNMTAKLPEAEPGSFKRHVIAVAGGGNVQDVDRAIDTAVAQGHFTLDQGSALKAHDGPLIGHPGAKTIIILSSLM